MVIQKEFFLKVDFEKICRWLKACNISSRQRVNVMRLLQGVGVTGEHGDLFHSKKKFIKHEEMKEHRESEFLLQETG